MPLVQAVQEDSRDSWRKGVILRRNDDANWIFNTEKFLLSSAFGSLVYLEICGRLTAPLFAIDEHCFASLAERCPQLRAVILHCVSNLTGNGIFHLVKRLKLKKLELVATDLDDDGLRTIAFHSSTLEDLTFVGCGQLTRQGLLAIFSNNSSLSRTLVCLCIEKDTFCMCITQVMCRECILFNRLYNSGRHALQLC